MAFPKIQFTETKRIKLASGLFIAHCVSMTTSWAVIGSGMFIKFQIESKVSFTEHYNNDFFPWLMIVIGILNVIVNIFGMCICIVTFNVAQRQCCRKLRCMHLPYVFVTLFISICLFVICMIAFHQLGIIHASFGDSLLLAMKQYKSDAITKKQFDRLQMDFQCCGSDIYHDWFNTSWIPSDLINLSNSTKVDKHLIKGEYFNDDVPFSCCDAEEVRPCIHHFVLDDSKHFDYHHQEKTTLYEQGCREILIEFFSNILEGSILVITVSFCFSMMIIVGMRYLQTSVHEAIDSGDPKSDAPGWLFNSCSRKRKDGINLNDNYNAKKEPLLPRTSDIIDNSLGTSDGTSVTLFLQNLK